jgi:hypothetical protein
VDPQQGKAVAPRSSLASLLIACALVGLALAPVAAGIAWYSFGRSGAMGVVAALIAALTCWVSASLALAAVFVGQRLEAGIHGILASMLFRMGFPLAVALALKTNSPPLAAAGVFWMILGLYLVALVVETLLSLQFVPRNRRPGVAAGAASVSSVGSGVQSR